MSRVTARYKGTEVHVSVIQGMFNPGGEIWREAVFTGGLSRQIAIMTAPARTGALKASHRRPYTNPAAMRVHTQIANTSDHAIYVHEGTTGPIFANNPTGRLWVRPTPHSWYPVRAASVGGRTPRAWVRGQRANPWMARALETAVRSRYGR